MPEAGPESGLGRTPGRLAGPAVLLAIWVLPGGKSLITLTWEPSWTAAPYSLGGLFSNKDRVWVHPWSLKE